MLLPLLDEDKDDGNNNDDDDDDDDAIAVVVVVVLVVVDIDERLGALLVDALLDALLDAFSHYTSCSRCFDIPDLYRRILRCMYSMNGNIKLLSSPNPISNNAVVDCL